MVENSQLPPEEAPVVEAPMEAKLIDELQKMEYEPLLPVEKKLIVWSIGRRIVCSTGANLGLHGTEEFG